MAEPRCSCGAAVQALTGWGMWRTVDFLDVHRVADMLTGELDYARCDAGCQLDLRATIVFKDDELGRVLVAPGELVDPSAVAANLPEELAERIDLLEDVNELRRIVRDLVDDRIRVFLPAVIGGQDGRGDVGYVFANWRKFTAPVFAAVGVALTGRIPVLSFSVTMVGRGESPPRDVSDRATLGFASRHWVVWGSLLAYWANGPSEGSFEDDLRDFVDRPPLVSDAAAREFAKEKLEPVSPFSDRSGATDSYRREALRASLFLRLNEPNPRADAWAFLWLWWEVGLRLRGEGGVRQVPELAVSVDRVRATIPPDSARWAAAELVNQALREGPREEAATTAGNVLEQIRLVFEEFGYQEQGASLISGLRLEVPVEELADKIVEFLGWRPPDWPAAIQMAKGMAGALVEAGRVDDLRRVADAMRAACPPEESINITLWFCHKLIKMGQPNRVLDEIGTGQPAEKSLPLPGRAGLLHIRVHALGQLGRRSDALALLDIAPTRVLEHPSHRQQLTVERARLVRELGFPAKALTLLETLLEESEQPDAALYETLSATLMRFGRYREAAAHARAAYTFALRDRMSWPVPRFAAQAMLCQALGGQRPDADLFDVIVRELDLGDDPETAVVAALALLVRGDTNADRSRREFLDGVVDRIPSIAEQAARDGRSQFTYRALYAAALYDQLYRPDHALESWERLVTVMAERHDMVVSDGLLYLAANLIRKSDWEAARPLLRRGLVSSTALLGNDSSIGLGASAGGSVHEFDVVTAATFAGPAAAPADLRLVGELRRGLASRRLPVRETTGPRPAWESMGLDDEVVAALAPGRGSVGVLEWVSDGVEARGLLTVVGARGSVRSTVVAMPEADLARLARRLTYRLSNWRPGRPGDPFDLAEWRAGEAWLRRLLDDHLADGDHLVVIPFAGWRQVPWHVVALERLTCSYSPSWVTLLDTMTRGRWPKRWHEGVVAVPRVGDPPDIAGAMARYVAAVTADARSRLDLLDGIDGDHAAVTALLESVDMATLLTHGYISTAENEVALMLAADGSLPLAHSVAAHSPLGRRHRFGWRDCAELNRAPQVILSAACGTGASQIVGLGEHLGFYNILRPIGLRAFVGPQWDIVAGDVLPILGEVRTVFLSKEVGLGQSLRTAIRHARDQGTSPWSAYALILEGDWR